jgi:curli biogenesis system outer membrane secretion channel CsgG
MFTSTHRLLGASLLALVTSLVPSATSQAQALRRVGVINFNLGEDAAQKAHASLGVSGNLGGDLSNMMIDRLVADHKFDVINMSMRPELSKELAHQQGANIDPNTAANLGKEVGVQTVLTGTITELSGDTSTAGFGVYKQQTFKVHVVAEVQMVDVETHRVLATAKGTGDAAQTKRGVVLTGNANLNTFGTGFGNGLLQQAATKAIDQIVQNLDASPYLGPVAAAPPAPRKPYQGMVADVTGSTVIFTIPSPDAAKVGDTVTLERVVKVIHSPTDPNKVLRTVTETAATGKVTEVDASSSTATAQMTGGPVKVKDTISYKP